MCARLSGLAWCCHLERNLRRRGSSMLRALYARLLARPAVVVLIAVATAIPMGYWSTQLFADVRADVKELLPASAPSVKALRVLEQRFGGFSQLSMVVESPDPDA